MKINARSVTRTLAVIALACAFLGQQAQAVSITGSITFSGGVELDTATAATATMVTAWHGPAPVDNPIVISASGDFALFTTPFVSAGVFTAPYSFASGPQLALWSSGGFTFDLTFSVVSSQGVGPGGGFVTASGLGTISGNGYTATAGTWSFSTQDPSAGAPPTFSFSASTGALPDGGLTLALLGFALVGVEGLRRKLKK